VLYSHAAEMASRGVIHLPSFLKTRAGFQALLRFCLSSLKGYVCMQRIGQVSFGPCTATFMRYNLRDCNVGITDVINDIHH
jgi:hypothetical protein